MRFETWMALSLGVTWFAWRWLLWKGKREAARSVERPRHYGHKRHQQP